VLGVTNPIATSGTGNFKIKSLSNGHMMDENETYTTIGVTPVPAVFTSSSFKFDGNSFARYSPNYRMKVTPSIDIPANSWARVTFAAGYTLTAG
jgi:hypothetical protein